MRPTCTLLLIVTMLALPGCNTKTPTTQSGSVTNNHSSATNKTTSPSTTDDPAKYSFHRNVAFTDVTKDMPSGSVDHIDFDMAAAPNVVVVVTVHTKNRDGLHFTTTFTDANGLQIIKEWQPASGTEPKDEHVGLFVLPDSVNGGTTVIH